MALLPATLRWVYSAGVLPFIKHLGVRGRLKFFIQTNGLYLLDSSDNVSTSTQVDFKKIKNQGDRFLLVDLIKNGSKLDGYLTEFRANLQGLFGAEVLSVRNEPRYVRYLVQLKRKEEAPINLSAPVEVAPRGFFQLNKFLPWDYVKRPHALVAGNTGSGKTFLLFYLIREAQKEGAVIWVADGKDDELAVFARSVGVKTVACSPDKIGELVELAVFEMESRFSSKASDFPPLFLFIDEFASLGLDMSKKDYQAMVARLKTLVLKGRRANIHLVFSLQRPSAESLPLDIRDNLDLRIGLGNLSKQNFEMVFGVSKKDSEVLSKGIGEGYLATGFDEVRAYYAPRLIL